MLLNEYGAFLSRLPIQRRADWQAGRSCIRAAATRQRMASISTAARIARCREILSSVHAQPAASVPVTRSLLRLPGNLRGPDSGRPASISPGPRSLPWRRSLASGRAPSTWVICRPRVPPGTRSHSRRRRESGCWQMVTWSGWSLSDSGCRVGWLPDALASGSHGRTTERRTGRLVSQVHRARKGAP